MDVRILCEILDELCYSHIVAHKLQHSTLHNVTLPLSWWSRLVCAILPLRKKNCELWGKYINLLCVLLRKMHEKEDCRT